MASQHEETEFTSSGLWILAYMY